jgi:hypothetical protein
MVANRLAWIAALAIAGVPLAPVWGTPPEDAPRVRLLVPAYFYPEGDGLKAWERLIAAADKVPIVAIVNPASGPGRTVDENYVEVFRKARGSKVTLIGYVHLNYAKRPIADVKSEVDRWLAFYPDIQGIFFDEQPSGAEQAPYALECFGYARKKIPKGKIVSNPGTTCAEKYVSGETGATVCLFEHHEGFGAYRPPKWADRYEPERFAILLYQQKGGESMRRLLREAIRKRAGYVYVTDDVLPNPWDRLPAYWEEEVAAVAEENGSASRK